MTQAVGVTTMPRQTPYLSVDMIKYHRRRGVRYEDLVPAGGMPDDNNAAIAELLEEASQRADDIMLGPLAATMDTVLDTVNINNRGFAVVWPRYIPLIGLTAASFGYTPGGLQALTSLAGVGVAEKSFAIPVGVTTPRMSSQGPIQFGGIGVPSDQAWIQYTYCHGFPVTELTAPVAALATTIDVLDTTGIIGGATYLTVYAGKNRHKTLVTAVSTAPQPGWIGTGPGTVTVATAFPFAIPTLGPYPTMVSALPSSAITAVGLIARGIVRTAGGGNVSASTTSGNRKQGDSPGDDFELAATMLAPYTVLRA